MRTLKRNQRKIYYATLIKGEPVTDAWGNETGEYNMVYSDPSPIRINVSAAQGRLETRQFGQMENYDRTLITDDLDCPIDGFRRERELNRPFSHDSPSLYEPHIV